MNKFKRDPYHFIKFFSVNSFGFGILLILLHFFKPISWEMSFSYLEALMIVSGLIFGLVNATAFHNASHGNIKPKMLNTLIGELTANFNLEDFRCFKVGHMLHHMHVDDPELDPHPPKGLTFLDFILKSRQKTICCISRLYYMSHGRTVKSELNVKVQIFLFHVAALLKFCFWLYLFGTVGFLFFYIPAYLSYFFGFAHLNYVSHRDENGEAVMQNHNENAFYKVMNVITSGGYFHKNHHMVPGLYNPQKLKRS